MTEIKLEPCPFCRSPKTVLLHFMNYYYVECRECAANGILDYNMEKAVESWNRVSQAVHHSTELAP